MPRTSKYRFYKVVRPPPSLQSNNIFTIYEIIQFIKTNVWTFLEKGISLIITLAIIYQAEYQWSSCYRNQQHCGSR